jgi:intracellular septation protein
MTFEADPNSPEHKKLNPIVKLLLELGPLGVFFFANARGEALARSYPFVARFGEPIFFATAAFIVATLIALAVSFAMTRKLPIMPLVTGIVVVVFGGLTLWLQDETFIKMKPTIVNALFGGVLLGGLVFGKSLLGYVFDSVFRLTDEGWNKLTFRWGLFFLLLAVLNEVVWRTVSTDTWVDFKVFGIMPLTFLFTMTQLPLIMRTSLPEEKAKP